MANIPRDRDVSCRQYGYITEKSNKKNVSMCADGAVKTLREKAIFTSESNTVDIILVTGTSSENNFLVKLNGKYWYILRNSLTR